MTRLRRTGDRNKITLMTVPGGSFQGGLLLTETHDKPKRRPVLLRSVPLEKV